MKKRETCEEKHQVKVIKQYEKKPYVPPKLTEYGSVEELTQGASGVGGDVVSRQLP